MKFTQIPVDTFEHLQMNAGIIVDDFNPETGEIGNLIGATNGGIAFEDSLSWVDFGDDIDNCPKNTKELKVLDQHEVKMSGTLLTVTAEVLKMLMGSADRVNELITPRRDLEQADFSDIWFVGDYSNVNTGENAGFLAIHLINALNTDGFKLQTTDKEKGKFAFAFTGHYSIEEPDTVPYEVYLKVGESGDATWKVIQRLTHCTSDFTDTTVDRGDPLEVALTAAAGYEFGEGSVSVTMGGIDITALVYSQGGIDIDAVTGDVVITAIATEIT